MKKNKLKKFLLAAAFIMTMSLLAACGGASSNDENKENAEGTKEEKTKIVIATAAMPKPFTYVDEKGELVGYDIEVAKAVFSRLPQYEVEFQKTEFPSVLAGLDSGMYQLAANNLAANKERQEKYIYTDPTFENQFILAVKEDSTDIQSFTDIVGKTTENQPGINYTTAIENYNKKYPDKQAKLNYTEADVLAMLQNVESGKTDFHLIDKAMLELYIEEFGLKLKSISLTEDEQKLIAENAYSYFLVSKGEEGESLAADVNKALKEVLEDGTVSEISNKYFGADFAPKSK